MSTTLRAAVCQRCGRGFVFAASYRDLLTRRGIKVKTPVSCVTCFRKDGPLPKQQGTVKWFNSRRRYGFVVTVEGLDVFLHLRQILDDKGTEPHTGQTTRFHVHYTQKGPEALNVELV